MRVLHWVIFLLHRCCRVDSLTFTTVRVHAAVVLLILILVLIILVIVLIIIVIVINIIRFLLFLVIRWVGLKLLEDGSSVSSELSNGPEQATYSSSSVENNRIPWALSANPGFKMNHLS
jgi:hypothetical protein